MSGKKLGCMFSEINLKLLSEALGELARGFKKLKTVVDTLKFDENSGAKVPIPGQNVTDGENAGISTSPETEGTPENWGQKVPAVITLSEAKEFLVSKKFGWGTPLHIRTQVYADLFGKRLRADKYKNHWCEDKTHKKGWRKISQKEFEDLAVWAENQIDTMSNIIEMNESDGHGYFCDAFGEVPDYKWDRRNNLHVAASVEHNNLKNFRLYCIGVHDSLGSLR